MSDRIIWVLAHCHLHPDFPPYLPPGAPRPECTECQVALDINAMGPVEVTRDN